MPKNNGAFRRVAHFVLTNMPASVKDRIEILDATVQITPPGEDRANLDLILTHLIEHQTALEKAQMELPLE